MKDPRSLRSIRRQLTLQILAGALVMLLVAGMVFFAVIHQRIDRRGFTGFRGADTNHARGTE